MRFYSLKQSWTSNLVDGKQVERGMEKDIRKKMIYKRKGYRVIAEKES